MSVVLLVDDRKENLALLNVYLQRQGIATLSATSGREGYEIAQSEQPDLILLDLLMPEASWDGYRLMTALSNNPATATIPVIAITAAGDLSRTQGMNFRNVLRRPFPITELNAVLAPYLVSAL